MRASGTVEQAHIASPQAVSTSGKRGRGIVAIIAEERLADCS